MPFEQDPKRPSSKLSHAAGFFELALDGQKTTAYLKSIEGGFPRAQVVEEAIGPDGQRVKHLSTVEIEPFSVEFGISGANSVLKWIQQSWKQDYVRHNGQVTHANFDLDQTFEHQFSDALILETTFPALDGASKVRCCAHAAPFGRTDNGRPSRRRIGVAIVALKRLGWTTGRYGQLPGDLRIS